MLNQRNERRIKTRDMIIERALGLDIGPGLDQEETLSAVDHALLKLERVLATMEAERAVGPDSSFAFRQFMERLRDPIAAQGGRVTVIENAAFMQIRSAVNGHRLYISKGKTAVGRIESTIPLGYVEGAIAPKHPNGGIRSWIPADVESVSQTIGLLGMERLPALG